MQTAIFAGQSNALGFLNNGPAPYTPTGQVQIWRDDHFEVMQPGVNTGTVANPNAWGPEVEFANKFLAAHQNDGELLVIGKSVHGETGVAQAPGLDWSPASRGEMFDATTKMVHDMEGVLQTHSVDVVAWVGGETDATNAADAGAHAVNLADLFAHMRTDWNADLISFARIGGQPEFSADVRYAEWLVDQQDPLATSFKTLDFAMQPDGLHYAEAGQLALGAGLYDGWISL